MLGVFVIVVGAAVIAARLPHRVSLGDLLLAGAAVLLLQGLVRDLARIRAAARALRVLPEGAAPLPHRAARCTCVESGIGVVGIVAGAVLLFSGSSIRFTMPPFAWPALAAGVTLFGWLVRDIVFDARLRRFRVERDHASLDVR